MTKQCRTKKKQKSSQSRPKIIPKSSQHHPTIAPSAAQTALGIDSPTARFRATHFTTRLPAHPLSPGANKPPQHVSKGTNKPPQHLFLDLISVPTTCFWSQSTTSTHVFGINKRPQHMFWRQQTSSTHISGAQGPTPSAPKCPKALPRGPKHLPRDPKGPKGILQQKQAN